jgi:hypothetical protein
MDYDCGVQKWWSVLLATWVSWLTAVATAFMTSRVRTTFQLTFRDNPTRQTLNSSWQRTQQAKMLMPFLKSRIWSLRSSKPDIVPFSKIPQTPVFKGAFNIVFIYISQAVSSFRVNNLKVRIYTYIKPSSIKFRDWVCKKQLFPIVHKVPSSSLWVKPLDHLPYCPTFT